MDNEMTSTPERKVEQDKTLEKLTFEERKCRCESTTFYTNKATNQVFKITVTGVDQQVLEQFTKELYVHLEVKNDVSGPPEQPADYKFVKPEWVDLEPRITMQIEIMNSANVKPPYMMEFVVDPPISIKNATSSQSYPFTGRWISASIRAVTGSMDATLTGTAQPSGASVSDSGPRVNSVGGAAPGNNKATFWISVNGDGTYNLTGQCGL